MLIPHVSVVGDGDGVLIDLSLVVNDSGSVLSPGPPEDLPAARVCPSSLDGLVLELIDDSSLLMVMMGTTAGASDNSGGGRGCLILAANVGSHLLLGTVRDLARALRLSFGGPHFPFLCGNLILR